MKETKALIDDATGLVENLIVVDGPFDPGPGKTLRDPAGAEIGGTWDGSVFQPKPVPPPPDLSKAQTLATAMRAAPDVNAKMALLESWLDTQ